MAIGFNANGITQYIPGFYGTVTVEGDFSNVVPSPRHILVVGEADLGQPYNDVDMRANYFTDMGSVKAAYGSGPVVDACAQLFSNQPNAVFSGSVGRVYIAKTNQSTQASHTIASPSGYGALLASVYGDKGNYIKAQIKDAVEEELVEQSWTWIPPIASANVNVNINGASVASAVGLLASAFDTSLTNLAAGLGANASVVSAFKALFSGTPDLTCTVSGDTITVTCTVDWTNTPSAGDTIMIPNASGIKGAADKNIGVYVCTSATARTITAKKIKSFNAAGNAEIAHVEPEAVAIGVTVAGDQTDWAEAEIMCFGKETFTSLVAPARGAGGSVEVFGASQVIAMAGHVLQWDNVIDLLSQDIASKASLAASLSGSDLTVTISDGLFADVPEAGDIVFISSSSVLAGAANANVGTWVVKSATVASIVINKTNGLTPAAVTSTFVNGDTAAIQFIPGIVSNTLGGKSMESLAERKVNIEASNVKFLEEFPDGSIGGEIALNISYYNASATVAAVSIDNMRRMIFSVTGATAPSTIYLNKYNSIRDLVDFLNTITGVSASVGNAKFASFPTTILDAAQSVGILAGGSEQVSEIGRIKCDYYLWVAYFVEQGSILQFSPGTLVYPAGLPEAEVSPTYLAGGAVGATANVDVTGALLASLTLPVRQVLPCFSRDARYDIEEGMTDPDSSYTIEGINLAVIGHTNTASNDTNQKRRLAALSFHGSFADSISAATAAYAHRASMTFQQVKTIDADGNVAWFLPWMLQAMVCAGRAQASLGTSMLRKNFRYSDIRHIGNLPVSSTTWVRDFDMESRGDITDAVQAGLLVFGPVPGSAVNKMISPDATTKSDVNNPTAYFYERNNVIFILDEVLETARSALENFIGEKTNNVTPQAAAGAVDTVIGSFLGSSLLAIAPSTVQDLGNGYALTIRVKPVEALEFISLNTIVTRSI